MRFTYGLGTVGMRVGKHYADCFLSPYIGVFYTNGTRRRWFRVW